eukprot:Blabericola_migrator_1__4381@NODE_2351_length_2902_cov_16_492416_g1470_i0_p3_GENE_NODE_2351_length_2902_cov_16_492416_g1470_i0NODE_2351_length_2902_cov_16_492416_g1470_i0_p3_ORF_typecomplete_len137_score13_37_NODE_2351_length_2902_cov_16_492416_g1470_i018192229
MLQECCRPPLNTPEIAVFSESLRATAADIGDFKLFGKLFDVIHTALRGADVSPTPQVASLVCSQIEPGQVKKGKNHNNEHNSLGRADPDRDTTANDRGDRIADDINSRIPHTVHPAFGSTTVHIHSGSQASIVLSA